MVKLEKILCFLFTLLVFYMVSQHCSIEGLQISAFDNCVDDPEWFTTDKDGNQHRCSDIGTSASCYDIHAQTGQEGWERCLDSCGNCAKGEVTVAPQDNLAFYSGDPVQDYGMVLFTDDERKWVGLDVGGDGKKDVRDTIMTDEAKSISDIYDRLNIVEDLYDMLLGSVSSCLSCEKYDMSECISKSDKCRVLNGECVPINIQSSTDKFVSCNGSELSCDYTVHQHMDHDTSQSQSSTTTSTTTTSGSSSSISGTTPSTSNTLTTQAVNGEEVVHKYVKHNCDNNGDCSLMFPTVEFKCSQIPQPESVTGHIPEIVYAPVELSARKCVTKTYLNTLNSNMVTTIDPSRMCFVDSDASDDPEDGEDDDSPDTEGKQSKINNCIQLASNEMTDSNNNDISRNICANVCNSINDSVQYISVDGDKCYCYKELPPTSSIFDVQTQNSQNNDNPCGSDRLEILNEGRAMQMTSVPMANVNPDQQMRDMCKSYFLLEKSLTGEDVQDMTSVTTSSSTSSSTDTTTNNHNHDPGMNQRISLYDVCPKQCKAQGCPAPTSTTSSSTTSSSTT